MGGRQVNRRSQLRQEEGKSTLKKLGEKSWYRSARNSMFLSLSRMKEKLLGAKATEQPR